MCQRLRTSGFLHPILVFRGRAERRHLKGVHGVPPCPYRASTAQKSRRREASTTESLGHAGQQKVEPSRRRCGPRRCRGDSHPHLRCKRCNRLRSFESLHWLMRIGGRPATSRHTGAGEPVEVYGAGVSVAAGLLRESTRVCVLAEVPPDRRRQAMVASRTKGGTSCRSCSTGLPGLMSARRR